jgi:hypothetical protein
MTRDQKIIRAKGARWSWPSSSAMACPGESRGQPSLHMGYSRDSFYRFKELYDKGGELALQEISRRKPILKNSTAPEIGQAVVAMAIEQPAWRQVRISEALKRRGLSIAAPRSDLDEAAPQGARSEVAQEGILLTDAQIVAPSDHEKV